MKRFRSFKDFARKALRRTGLAMAVTSFVTLSAGAAEQTAPRLSLKPTADVSLKHEVKYAIDKGITWLQEHQNGTNGCWSGPDHPAMTALALIAFQGQPEQERSTERPPVKKGYDFLLSNIKPDGGIYRKDLLGYNSSICLTALSMANRPDLQPVIANARKFVIGLQADYGEPGQIDTALDGGIGYGIKDKTPDLSNTSWALEALYYSKRFADEKKLLDAPDLNWKAAIHFIQSCQNLPAYNSEKWSSDDPQNKGGFIYAPGSSKAGETNSPSGRIALRSYGSISYAGLLSYIYADLKPNDPRVAAVMEWLSSNYAMDENPGMGKEGLYYYYHTMAKALTLAGVDTLETKDGGKINWRKDLSLKLINLQHADGAWANENGRWFEKEPALVTSFSLIALEMIYRGL